MVQHSMIERLRSANKGTNSQDATQLRSPAYRPRIAEALSNAVRKYQTSLKSVTKVASQ